MSASEVRIAPEGRYRDFYHSKLIASPNGGRTFSVVLGSYGASLEGRLVPHGSGYRLRDGKVRHGTTKLTVPNRVLNPL